MFVSIKHVAVPLRFYSKPLITDTWIITKLCPLVFSEHLKVRVDSCVLKPLSYVNVFGTSSRVSLTCGKTHEETLGTCMLRNYLRRHKLSG